MTGFRPEMQVKQYVAEVSGQFGFRFRVFTTGSDRHYLFVCAQTSAIQFPVKKTDLRRDVRSALASGRGRAWARPPGHPPPPDDGQAVRKDGPGGSSRERSCPTLSAASPRVTGYPQRPDPHYRDGVQ